MALSLCCIVPEYYLSDRKDNLHIEHLINEQMALSLYYKWYLSDLLEAKTICT